MRETIERALFFETFFSKTYQSIYVFCVLNLATGSKIERERERDRERKRERQREKERET